MSTIDETNNSSTNSIITEINNGSIGDNDDFSLHSISSNLANDDDLFETQTIRGSSANGQNDDRNVYEMEPEVCRKKLILKIKICYSIEKEEKI